MMNIKLYLILILSVGLKTISANSQDTIVTNYDRYWNAMDDANTAVFHGKMYKKDTLWVFQNFYNNGQLHMSGAYLDKACTLETGKFVCYYETGKARAILKYANGQLQGRQIEFWENGKLKRQEIYKQNKYFAGGIFDTLGAEIYYPPEWVFRLTEGELPGLIHTLDTLMIYGDTLWNDTLIVSEDISYGKIHLEKDVWLVRYYNDKDQVCGLGSYQNDATQSKVGTFTYYHDNGTVKRELNYENGLLNGLVRGYFDDGILKRIESYANDHRIRGKVFDHSGNELEYYPYIELAEYTGGEKKLIEFLALNVNYPKVCQENGLEGRVYVKFKVSREGNVETVKVLKSVHYAFDKEAVRVIHLMPRWTPARVGGIPVACEFSLPINFTLLK